MSGYKVEYSLAFLGFAVRTPTLQLISASLLDDISFLQNGVPSANIAQIIYLKSNLLRHLSVS